MLANAEAWFDKFVGVALALVSAGFVWIVRTTVGLNTRVTVLEAVVQDMADDVKEIKKMAEADARENRENLRNLTSYLLKQ